MLQTRSQIWNPMRCTSQILNLVPSELNNLMVCVAETAMGTTVHAQEDLESTYVSAVYEWVCNMLQEMLTLFIRETRNVSTWETTSVCSVLTVACQFPSYDIEEFLSFGLATSWRNILYSFQGLNSKPSRAVWLLPVWCLFLVWLTLQLCSQRRYLPLKHQLTSTGLYGILSQLTNSVELSTNWEAAGCEATR
jgi:hypothetical protein